MPTMNISLPDTLKDFIDGRVSNDGYGNVSEYFRELVRADQKRREQEKLETLLLIGLQENSGATLTKEDLDEIKRRGLERVKSGLRK